MKTTKNRTLKVNVASIVEVPGVGEVPTDLTHARSLLKSFCSSTERGEDLMPGLQRYLARTFRRILGGESADTALGLKRDRAGRPPRDEVWPPKTARERRDHWLAAEVMTLLAEGHKSAQAYETAASRWNGLKRKPSASTATTQRAWTRWSEFVRYEDAARKTSVQRSENESGRLGHIGRPLYAKMSDEGRDLSPARKASLPQGSRASVRSPKKRG